jgi:hypothetical protein
MFKDYIIKKFNTLLFGSMTIASFVFQSTGEPITLNANFRLFGEVYRFGLGYGDMALHFGVNAGMTAPEIGSLGYIPGGVPYTTGVLSGVTLPGVVDVSFSVPFTINTDEESSLYMGIGENGMSGPDGGSIQTILDFSDNISYTGNWDLDQGFSLLSVTTADGGSLADAGYSFEFINENTVLTAFASAFDATGSAPVTSVATPADNRAAVFLFPGTATAKLQGGYNRSGIPTDYLVNLDISPETDPYIYDVAGASVSGSGNVILRSTGTANVPEPDTVILLCIGMISVVGLSMGKRLFKQGEKNTISI